MEILEHKQTIQINDIVVVHDPDKEIVWYILLERIDGGFPKGREMVNYNLFLEQGAEYMQKVYSLAVEKTCVHS